MNEQKIQRLLAAARREAPPAPPDDFASHVTAAVRREPAREPGALFDQLDRLFPRLAVAALVVIGLCAAADLGHSLVAGPDLAEGVTQLCAQWQFPEEGF